MEKIAAGERLKNTIKVLEVDQAVGAEQLKQQFDRVAESMKPVNLVKNTVKDMITSPKLGESMLGIATGLVTGYLSKRIVVGTSGNLFRKFIGTTIQVVVTKFIAKHPETIKSTILVILKNIRPKSKER